MAKYILFFLVLLGSCTSKRTFLSTSEKQKEIHQSSSDSVNITTINQEINDLISLPVKVNNKQVDSLLLTFFSGFHTYKNSGNNKYAIKYNEQKRAFEFKARIGKTQTQIITKTDTIIRVKDRVVTKIKKVVKVKKRIPLWIFIVWLISLIGVYLLVKFKIF